MLSKSSSPNEDVLRRNSKSACGTRSGSTTFTLTGPLPGAYVSSAMLLLARMIDSDSEESTKSFKPFPFPSILVKATPSP